MNPGVTTGTEADINTWHHASFFGLNFGEGTFFLRPPAAFGRTK